MSLEKFVQDSGFELLFFFVCVYCGGIRLLYLHDISIIRSKSKPPVKDEKAYIKYAGILTLILGVIIILMALLRYVSAYAALVEICVGVIIIGILWKRMDKKYGA